jgi:hypothetical protein
MSAAKSVKNVRKPSKALQIVLAIVIVLVAVVAVALWTPFLGLNLKAMLPGEPTVQAERLDATHIGIKIEFPDEVSGDFSGFILGRHFDCQVSSSKVVYCIGPLDAQLRSGLFYLYAADSETPVLEKTVTILSSQKENEQTVQEEQDSSSAPSVNSANQQVDPNDDCGRPDQGQNLDKCPGVH